MGRASAPSPASSEERKHRTDQHRLASHRYLHVRTLTRIDIYVIAVTIIQLIKSFLRNLVCPNLTACSEAQKGECIGTKLRKCNVQSAGREFGHWGKGGVFAVEGCRPCGLPERPREGRTCTLVPYLYSGSLGAEWETLYENDCNLEASPTFLDRCLLKYFSTEVLEDDCLDLWLDVLGFPDYTCSFEKEILICYLFNSSEHIHLYFKTPCLDCSIFQHLVFSS